MSNSTIWRNFYPSLNQWLQNLTKAPFFDLLSAIYEQKVSLKVKTCKTYIHLVCKFWFNFILIWISSKKLLAYSLNVSKIRRKSAFAFTTVYCYKKQQLCMVIYIILTVFLVKNKLKEYVPLKMCHEIANQKCVLHESLYLGVHEKHAMTFVTKIPWDNFLTSINSIFLFPSYF